jgi:glycyl-tRNA synthetase
MGKAFRNEVTPRNFTFRSREFEQMELEFFIRPDEAIEALQGSVASVPPQGHPGEPQPNWGWQAWHRYWVEERVRFYQDIGLSRATLGFHVQAPEELAHYARATVDILFKFPFSKEENGEVKGDELEGIAARGDFDLSQHEKFSGKPLTVFDEEVRGAWTKLPEEKKTGIRADFVEAKTRVNIEKKRMALDDAAASARKEADVFFERLAKGQYLPHVIEPSAGADRLILALVCNAFSEMHDPDDKGKSDTRVVMRFHPRVAPIKVAVLPLLKNKPDLVAKAHGIYDNLRQHMMAFYDDGGSIGRRYARQDEAGTPFCVTVDFETLEGMKEGPLAGQKDTVTIRYRGNTDEENGRQERVKISELLPLLLEKIR